MDNKEFKKLKESEMKVDELGTQKHIAAKLELMDRLVRDLKDKVDFLIEKYNQNGEEE